MAENFWNRCLNLTQPSNSCSGQLIVYVRPSHLPTPAKPRHGVHLKYGGTRDIVEVHITPSPHRPNKKGPRGPFCTQTKITWSANTRRCPSRISLSTLSAFCGCHLSFRLLRRCEDFYKPSTDEALQGTYHRGIDDARNVASIVKEMLS